MPILIGGTGLYVDAVIDNLEIPEVKPNLLLRKKLEKELEKVKAAQEASAKLTTIIGELQQMNRKAPAGGSTDDESNPLY